MGNARKMFIKKLTEIVDKGAFSVTEIAQKSGVSRSMLYNVMADRHSISLDFADKVAGSCGMNLGSFLGGSDHTVDECNRRVQKAWKKMRRKKGA